MIAVKVKNLSISKYGFVVFLDSVKDNRTLPIVIGAAEAQAIVIKLNKIDIPRPITHDLMKSILDVMEGRLKRVIITDLKEGTYYANLVISSGDHILNVDSRPSDAIALALRFNAPIFVEDAIMNKAGVVLADQESEAAIERTVEESIDPVEQLKEQLEQAISEERYEDAAQLRDQIKKESNTN